MKYITTIINRFKTKDIPNPVGRWRIEKCNKAMNNKIDLANEDHCGPCGQYTFDKGKLTYEDKSSPFASLNNVSLRDPLCAFSAPG